MDIILSGYNLVSNQQIKISGSKSESNRVLLLQALYPNLKITNLSNSNDSKYMQKALLSDTLVKDIHHAGTAMRFLTAYYATQNLQQIIMQGSQRMHERPIEVLVDALRQLDAKIDYIENSGFPPLKISGTSITKNKVQIQANVSSQYISALLLVAPKLKNGLQIELLGEITSIPYIKMTLQILTDLGIENSFNNNIIIVKPSNQLKSYEFTVESDWSSASYFYSIVALQNIGFSVTLSAYKQNSLQGDSILQNIYQVFGVKTVFNEHSITLTKVSESKTQNLELDLQNAPDIAQTIAVTCLGLGIACSLTGLHTLKIKETDRLLALQTEISKFGAQITTTIDSLTLQNFDVTTFKNLKTIEIKTYQDHRMAMAFAPLAAKCELKILEAEVVSKSFVDFWDNMKTLGFNLQ